MRTNPFFRVVFLAAQSYSITVLGLLIGILSARGLSVSDRGTLAIILLITQLCSRIGSIGFEQVIHREGIKKNPQVFYLTGVIGSLLSLPIAFISTWTSHISLGLALIIVIVAGFISILRINLAWLIYLNKLKVLFLLNIGQSILQFLLYAVVFNIGSLAAFLLVWIANIVIFSLISIVVLHILTNQVHAKNIKIGDMLNAWRKGFEYVGVAVPEMALTFCLELPIIRYLLGGTAVGLYSISNTLNGIYYQLFVSITNVFSKNTPFKFPRFKVYTVLLILLTLGVLSSKPLIAILFGKSYSDSAWIFAIMAPATFLLGISRIEYILIKKPSSSQTQAKLSAFLIFALLMGIFVDYRYILYYISLSYSTYALISIASSLMKNRENVKL